MDQAELINEFVILLLHSACINQARLPINALNTGSSKRKGAKFGEGCSVRADWLRICCPKLMGCGLVG